MLSDKDILDYLNGKHIRIFTSSPYNGAGREFNKDKQIQLGSVDLRVFPEIKRFIPDFDRNLSLDVLHKNDYIKPEVLKADEKLIIKPGEIILASTLEMVVLSEEFAGFITGRSSVARLGVMVQCCQDFINPGHGQTIPLQLVNLSPNTVELDQDVPLCQLILFRLATPSNCRYVDKADSKYKKETGPLPSKLYEDKKSGDKISEDKISEGKASVLDKPYKRFDVKSFLRRYISPLLPSLVMSTFFTVLIYNNIASLNIPVWLIVAAVVLVLYIWMRKDEEK
jgi:dCTP deaminase